MKNTDFNRIMASGNDYRILAIAVSFSVVIKSVLIINSDVVNDDAVRYVNSAYQLMQGNLTAAILHEKMLFFTFVLGLVHSLVNDWGLSGQLVSATFLTLTLFPLYFLTKHLFDERAAVWAVAVFNLVPVINDLASEVVKDAPFLFFMTTALWYGCKAQSESRFSSHLMAICCAALAALFRFEGIIFLGLYFVWLLFHAGFRPASRPHALRGLLLYLAMLAFGAGIGAGLLLFGSVEIVTIKTVCQRFSQHYFKLDLLGNYHTIYDHMKSVEHNFAGGQWSNDIFEIARHLLPLIYLLGLLQLLVASIFPLYVIPLCLGLWTLGRSVRNVGLLLWTVLAYLLMAYFFIVTRNFLSERYVTIVVVLLLPIVAHGFEELRARSVALKPRKTVAALAVALFVILPIYQVFADISDEKTEILLAGKWLKHNRDLTLGRMVTTDERVPFYAGLFREQYEIFPATQGGEIDRYALQHNCSLMVVDVPLQSLTALPAYEKYALAKEFPGKHRAVLIYEKMP